MRRRSGFTLLEVIVAIVLSVLVVEIAWDMLSDQKSNMVGIRQRLRVQAVAREALKTMESEIRIAGFGQQFKFLAGSQGRIDSLDPSTGLTRCSGIADANGSSVSAVDGRPGKSDTLTVGYPTTVLPSTGTNCSEIQWSRYFVNGDSDLVRVSASTLSGLSTSTDATVIAKGVDVFQVRLALMGPGSTTTTLLNATEGCCANLSSWTAANATATVSGTSIVVAPNVSNTWTFFSVAKTLKAGEKWRDTLFIEPNGAFFKDVKANGASLAAGLFTASGTPVSTVDLITYPATDSSISAISGGLGYGFEMVATSAGSYKLGLKGVSKGNTGTSIRVQTMNATLVGKAPGADWWKNPGSLAAADWPGVRQVQVILLARVESMEDAKSVVYSGLANYVQSSGDTGVFKATDRKSRAVFDHIYPVGNNGI